MVLVILLTVSSLNAKNVGKQEYPAHIASSLAHLWNTVVIFKVRKRSKIHRATAEVESRIKSLGHKVILDRIGSIDKCVIAAVRKDNHVNLYSILATATNFGDISEVYSRKNGLVEV